MAQPFVAFASLDGREFVCVWHGDEDEDHQSVEKRARNQINEIADADPMIYNVLSQSLRVVSMLTALQEPYSPYLTTTFDLQWLQVQVDKQRHQGR